MLSSRTRSGGTLPEGEQQAFQTGKRQNGKRLRVHFSSPGRFQTTRSQLLKACPEHVGHCISEGHHLRQADRSLAL
jgi:hypothetical protein